MERVAERDSVLIRILNFSFCVSVVPELAPTQKSPILAAVVSHFPYTSGLHLPLSLGLKDVRIAYERSKMEEKSILCFRLRGPVYYAVHTGIGQTGLFNSVVGLAKDFRKRHRLEDFVLAWGICQLGSPSIDIAFNDMSYCNSVTYNFEFDALAFFRERSKSHIHRHKFDFDFLNSNSRPLLADNHFDLLHRGLSSRLGSLGVIFSSQNEALEVSGVLRHSLCFRTHDLGQAAHDPEIPATHYERNVLADTNV